MSAGESGAAMVLIAEAEKRLRKPGSKIFPAPAHSVLPEGTFALRGIKVRFLDIENSRPGRRRRRGGAVERSPLKLQKF